MLEEQACALDQQHAHDQERAEAVQAEYTALQAEYDLVLADLDIRQNQVGYYTCPRCLMQNFMNYSIMVSSTR